MIRYGQCPKCGANMEIITIIDARNPRGRWLNAEFTICPKCAYPVLRVVESGRWKIVVASDGVATEMEAP